MIKGNAQLFPAGKKKWQLCDVTGELVGKITDSWLLSIRETNPAILDMFKDSDRAPQRDMLPWSGEFAGKYLTGAAQLYSLTGDGRLKKYISEFASEMLGYQKKNGYMGPWPEEFQLTGRAPVMAYCFDPDNKPHDSQTWDTWAHYHIMSGLLRWYEASGEQNALDGLLKIADCFMDKFFGDNNYRMWDNGDQDMNLAPYHIFVKLYNLTGEKKYLDFALEIERDLEKPPAGDYIRCALAGQEFYQMPKPRWESLHAVEGIAEMYLATGDEDYKTAFERIWWSILKTDVHNTGGFSSREQAVGNPFNNWQIETCCVIAYMATTVDMIRLTGSSLAADVMEWETFNAGLGAFSPSGRWSTYNTPMEGYKRASYHDIGFQCRPGSPDLNCCSVNAPRAFGMINDWGCMTGADGTLYLNYYGEGELALDGFTIRQKTGYPYNGSIKISVSGAENKKLRLALRIPFWSRNNRLFINGVEQEKPVHSSYYILERVFKKNDEVVLELDFSLRFSGGEDAYSGKSAVFYGPMLLCFDPFYDEINEWEKLPNLDSASMRVKEIKRAARGGALYICETSDGGELTLCDLFTAGVSGNPYTTWLTVDGVKAVPFTKENPQRAIYPE